MLIWKVKCDLIAILYNLYNIININYFFWPNHLKAFILSMILVRDLNVYPEGFCFPILVISQTFYCSCCYWEHCITSLYFIIDVERYSWFGGELIFSIAALLNNLVALIVCWFGIWRYTFHLQIITFLFMLLQFWKI